MSTPRKQPPTRRNADGLTALQAALVDAMLAGAHSVSEAGRTAGYADASSALRAWHTDAVQQAVESRLKGIGLADAALALTTRRNLMLTARSEHVKLDAAKDALNRAGVGQADQASSAPVSITIMLD